MYRSSVFCFRFINRNKLNKRPIKVKNPHTFCRITELLPKSNVEKTTIQHTFCFIIAEMLEMCPLNLTCSMLSSGLL